VASLRHERGSLVRSFRASAPRHSRLARPARGSPTFSRRHRERPATLVREPRQPSLEGSTRCGLLTKTTRSRSDASSSCRHLSEAPATARRRSSSSRT
jgi:hypothetical protein